MKKLLVFLILTMSFGIQAYHLTVANRSSYRIKVKANFAGSGICGSKQFNVRPHKEEKKNVKGCCLKKIEVQSLKTGDSDKKYKATPRKSGFIGSCFSNKFIVFRNDDGSLTVEDARK